MKVTRVHLKRLRILAKFLRERVPRGRFIMHQYATGDLTECNTSACALGWATVVFPHALERPWYPFVRSTGKSAETYFGGDLQQGNEAIFKLFFGGPSTPVAKAREIEKVCNKIEKSL